MAGSLLVPMSVVAKRVTLNSPVPSLTGAPFNSDSALEPGVHVHWALPDALTGGKTDKTTRQMMFPGVPDLWLVVRFNPAPPPNTRVPQRAWRAWVVDSRTQQQKDLAVWKMAVGGDPKSVHTVLGMLPTAAGLGSPGWGIADAKSNPHDVKDPKPYLAAASYYPEARHRLGLYDDLSDLAAKTGNISYTVIGWYSERETDPLYMSGHPLKLLKEWKLRYPRTDWLGELSTPVALNLVPDAFKPPNIVVTQGPSTAEALQVAQRLGTRGGSLDARMKKLDAMQKSVAPAAASAGPALQTIGPSEILCHGSAMQVSLAGIAPDSPPMEVHAYPSMRRALAEVAAIKATSDTVDFTEMLLQDLDQQRGSLAGILDLPGEAHALSFQGVAGKSRNYARIDIRPPVMLQPQVGSGFTLAPHGELSLSTGYWPHLSKRSASMNTRTSEVDPKGVFQQPATLPTQWEIKQWLKDVRKAFDNIDKNLIDLSLVRVHDSRPKAQPPSLVGYVRPADGKKGDDGKRVAGRMAQGEGSDGAAWWIDINDDDALTQILVAKGDATIDKPDAARLYEMPTPRWYRPWSPHMVVFAAGRSYRFGFDGRFDSQGFLECRLSAQTMHAMVVSNAPEVIGHNLLWKPESLAAVTGLPPEVRSILEEALLLDTETAVTMALLASSPGHVGLAPLFSSAILAFWMSRSPKLSDPQTLSKIHVKGHPPSPVALTSCSQDLFDPLFVDTDYSHPHSSLETDWQLSEDQVEMNWVNQTKALNPPPPPERIQQRSHATVTLAQVLKSRLVTMQTADPAGDMRAKRRAPAGLTEETFDTLNAISAPLSAFDATLLDRQYNQRTGALRLNRVNVVDVFGASRPVGVPWSSGIDPLSTAGGPLNPFWTALSPRLPYWARLSFRLQQAWPPPQPPTPEANPLKGPVIGILLPDLIEHALEVYDDTGRSIGQLTSDRPYFGPPTKVNKAHLAVTFTANPWVMADLNLPLGHDLDSIKNSNLHKLVAGIVAQPPVDVAAGAPATQWNETALTALLRVIDTVRGTLEPSSNTADRKMQLIGEPILVLAARVSLETCSDSNPAALNQDHPPAVPNPPAVHVRIGDVTRPDDGVLGCFLQGATDADAKFAPVSQKAADQALCSLLTQTAYTQQDLSKGVPVTHPFIKGQTNQFLVPQDLIILAESRGALYATCGVLPRKKIIIPQEFITTALRNMEPSFHVGPLLAAPLDGSMKPYMPPPKVDGYQDLFVYREAGTGGASDTYPAAAIPPASATGEVPEKRAMLVEGWVRLTKPKK